MIFRKALLLVSAVILCLSCSACSRESAEETTTAETTEQAQTYATTAYALQEIRTEKTYYHAALQGAVIVEQGRQPKF